MLVATPLALVALIAAGCGSSGTTTTVSSGSSGGGPSASARATIHGKYSRASTRRASSPRSTTTAGAEARNDLSLRVRTWDDAETDDETVTDQTKNILGNPSTVVDDLVSEHGKAVERTRDYYARDEWGNVW